MLETRVVISSSCVGERMKPDFFLSLTARNYETKVNEGSFLCGKVLGVSHLVISIVQRFVNPTAFTPK
jgi:hypothetical protein